MKMNGTAPTHLQTAHAFDPKPRTEPVQQRVFILWLASQSAVRRKVVVSSHRAMSGHIYGFSAFQLMTHAAKCPANPP